jgi:plasmid stabilization system protein ParE
MKYRLTEEAQQELIQAGRYYAAEDRRLLGDLETEVDRALRHLSDFPRAAKLVDHVHRGYKLRRFPHVLIYRIEDDELVVIAAAHPARKEGYWRGRLSGDS